MSLQTVQDWFRHGPSPLPIDIVVPVSGGKDSQACLKLACRERDAGKRKHVIGLFNDTRFEHPWTYAHVERLSEVYNVPILKTEGSSVEREVLRYGRFPGGGARHCTSELKMNASKKFYRALSLYQRGFEVWYGVRSDESREREQRYRHRVCDELYLPNEVFPSSYPQYLGKLGVRFRLPILDWSTEEVFEFLGDEKNPLYEAGFNRVGCFPCLAGGDADKIRAFEFDDFGRAQREKVKQMERAIGKSCFTSGVGKRWEAGLVEEELQSCESNPGCSICSM